MNFWGQIEIDVRKNIIKLLVSGVVTLALLALPPQAAERSQIRFENHQKLSRVDFILNNSTTDDKPVIDAVLGGVALLDYDNDGYLDIFFTNGARIPGLAKDSPDFSNRLYHNNGEGTFTDVTERAGVAGIGPNGKKLWSVSAAWIDYDNDGRLDLFVSNYLDWTFETSKVCGPPGRRLSCSPTMYKGEPNFLHHNNGDGPFTDVSAATGIAEHIGKGMGVAIADYNDDGWMDIFVANDKERNFLFKNRGGKSFEEVGVESFVAFTEDGIPVSSMGVDFRDWNNDGKPSLFVTALGRETFPLFRNEGTGSFSVDTYKAGIGFPSLKMSGWGNGIYDFDNDGFKDLFTANSHVSDNADDDPQQHYRQANAVFQNLQDGAFRDVSTQSGPDMQVRAAHRGCAFGDLNNDGKIDVVVSVIGDHAELLYNTTTNSNHWILLQTIGVKSNRDGIGTRIKLTGESGLVQYNHVTTAGSFASSSDKRVHFGLGRDTRIKEIELRWTSGRVQVLRNVKVDQILKITESEK